MSLESTFRKQVFKKYGAHPDFRLFPNVSASLRAGEFSYRASDHIKKLLRPGDVVLHGGRRMTVGLAEGSADLIGIKRVPVISLPRDGFVGVFTSIELKTPNVTTEEPQTNWLSMVRRLGGRACVARTLDEVVVVLGVVPPSRT